MLLIRHAQTFSLLFIIHVLLAHNHAIIMTRAVCVCVHYPGRVTGQCKNKHTQQSLSRRKWLHGAGL